MDAATVTEFLQRFLPSGFGGEPWRWAAALGTVAFGWLVGWALGAIGRRRAAGENTHANVYILAHALTRSRGALLAAASLWPGLRWVTVPPNFSSFAKGVTTVALGIQLALCVSGALQAALQRERDKREAEGRIAEISSFGLLRAVGLAVVWTVATLAVLSNLGVEITALVASLGVGGIAVALAAQNVLGDLLASLSIILDRPFEVGDFVIVGAEMGTVMRIGLKTTRVRALGGEELVFGNADLLNARVRNIKRMEERRVAARIGLLYSSPVELVERVPGEMQAAVETQERARFDRAHFVGFGPSSLDFELVYWIRVPDHPVFMDVQQSVNLELLRRVQGMGLGFAFPTQTVHIESMPDGSD